MSEKKVSEQARMNGLFEQYGLNKEDHFFETAHYKIITRAGIDQIQASARIGITYKPVPEFSDAAAERFVVKAIGTMITPNDGVVETIETFGEVDPSNYSKKVYKGGPNKGNNLPWYPIAMAEKRAMSRCVLKLAGFYALNVFGEDEADDFKDTVKAGKQSAALTPEIK